MYYRRKVLLALIEAFGGGLKSIDCVKLLFNFCQQTDKNYYDFFPYKYGPFSFVSYYDKRRLIELGMLRLSDDFQLAKKRSYLNTLTDVDRAALLRFRISIGNLRGSKLIRMTYRDYPQYSARSKIAGKLFGADELQQLKFAWNTDTKPLVFTIGYEGLTIDAFLNKLIANNVTIVADVRNNPQSMKYGFSKRSFQKYIESAGIRYAHMPELGVPSGMRKGLGETLSHKTLFATYACEMLPQQDPTINQFLELSNAERIALVCFEANHNYCHRHVLIDYLKKNKAFKRTVMHL